MSVKKIILNVLKSVIIFLLKRLYNFVDIDDNGEIDFDEIRIFIEKLKGGF